jgi:predicted DNA-binding transcriptional regulator AlpA
MTVHAHDLPERLWTLEETARFLALPVATLYALNHKRTGPRFHKVGRHCRYDPREVRAWLDGCVSERGEAYGVR